MRWERPVDRFPGTVHGSVRRDRDAAVRRPPVVTSVLIVCISTTFVRLQVDGRLPTLRFVADAYSPRALAQGHLRLLATSTLLSRDIFMVVSISVSLAATLGVYEVIAGHLRALLLAIVAATLGPVLVTAALGLLVAFGNSWALGRLGTLDIGASAIIAAASAATAGALGHRRLTVGLLLFLLGGLLLHHQMADWEHMLIFPLGYAAGRFLGRASPPHGARASHRAALLTVSGICALSLGLIASGRLLPAPPVLRTVSGVVLSPARVVDATYAASSLGHAHRHVLVLLPAGYDSTRDRYPVVELLHGYPGRPEDLFSLGRLQTIVAARGIAPFIAVIPDGVGPRVSDSWFADVPGQHMGSAVSVDLRPWVARTFRTTPSWSYAGLSAGGFAAAYLPIIDPGAVHAVCGLSGYYTGPSVPFARAASAAARRRLSPIGNIGRAPALTFLAYGLGDVHGQREATRYARALLASGRQVRIRAYGGRHEWTVWRPAFRDCFKTIVPAPPTR